LGRGTGIGRSAVPAARGTLVCRVSEMRLRGCVAAVCLLFVVLGYIKIYNIVLGLGAAGGGRVYSLEREQRAARYQVTKKSYELYGLTCTSILVSHVNHALSLNYTTHDSLVLVSHVNHALALALNHASCTLNN